MSLLRLATAGSVDDGKSTLIGRLLLDSRCVSEDQLSALRLASQRRGVSGVDLAMLTDGLKAEREQGITIDVAYRYASTARRKFIIADCPGHVEYTRNMVTGTSTADVAVIIVDAAKGPQEQTRRHGFVASLLRVPHVVACVNKMDLVGYSQEAFRATALELEALARRLDIKDAVVIPISALHGDNIVERSPRMPWYEGRSLLAHLENLEPRAGAGARPLRLPVQGSIVAPGGGRSCMGSLVSGSLSAGDEIIALPSGKLTRVLDIALGGSPLSRAQAPQAVTLRLADEIDVGRGDMLASPQAQPRVASEFEAVVCWLGGSPLSTEKRYLLRHGTAECAAVALDIARKIDVNSLAESSETKELRVNEFAAVRLRTSRPLCCDAYREDRATGAFILIDAASLVTVGAGTIL